MTGIVTSRMTTEVPDTDFSQSESKNMFVLNRNGEKEEVSFDKILKRIQKLSYGLHSLVDPPTISQAVINGVSLQTCFLVFLVF